MRNKFFNVFCETILEMAKTMPEALCTSFERTSMQNKMLKLGGYDPKVIYQGFYNVEKRKLLKCSGEKLRLTRKGIRHLEYWRFQNLNIQEQKWDGKWRIIIFDIPEELKKQRNILRSKLKVLGFFMLQKSVFVSPLACEKELNFAIDYLDVRDFSRIITASSLGCGEQEIRKYFGL